MRPTRTLLGKKAQQSIRSGVNSIYDTVSRTIGPEGKNALLYRSFNRGCRITNDGVTVADTIEPKDPFVRLAADAFKEGCKRTNERVGDGTTTTAVIGGKLFNDIYNLSEGQSEFTTKKSIGVISLKKKILETAELVKEEIKKSAQEIKTLEDLEKIAIVSVENEKLGKIIAKMAWEVGIDGFIDVVEGYKGEIETEVIKGMRFPAKVPAKAFVNNPARYEMVIQDCPVFITNHPLDNASEMASTFQKFNGQTSKIIIIAPSFSDNVLVNMINATKAGFFMFPVKAPSLRTEQFEDLAIYCGANFIDKAKGKSIRTTRFEDLGFLEKLIVKDTEAKEDAIATGGRGATGQQMFDNEISTAVQKRIGILKAQMLEQKQENFKKMIERRIASMSSAVGIIRVGDSTQASSLYTKLKIEDAVYACKAALRGGYVKGGGLCLKEIADSLSDDNLLKSALLHPYELIQNSVEGGIDIKDEIIDPMEAVYYAVEHAVSVVANLITCDIITQEIEDPFPGDGEFAIANAINSFVLMEKKRHGILTENEEEVEKDRLAQVDEMLSNDNG